MLSLMLLIACDAVDEPVTDGAAGGGGDAIAAEALLGAWVLTLSFSAGCSTGPDVDTAALRLTLREAGDGLRAQLAHGGRFAGFDDAPVVLRDDGSGLISRVEATDLGGNLLEVLFRTIELTPQSADMRVIMMGELEASSAGSSTSCDFGADGIGTRER